ncbi:hypothetical protein [Polyangium sp. 6x1]|uniref:hypothetical protein n=1 Tax=Polyangium sp. 6x1 TaxID=3042689 RepID=UPI0024823069|nr:hypothetical protein [Polyangium sp. 6x1]MDI1444857.1 hypothetical protein [Polyangium sp. 6x1]
MNRDEKIVLGVLGALASVAGATGLYYLLAGAGKDKNAALIPDSIEDRLDMVVESLNETFGKSWGRYAISALKKALPAPLVALVQFVHAAEQHRGVSGAQKRAYATQLWQQYA